MVNLSADIIPGESAAGFVLGQHYVEGDFGDVAVWDRSKGPLGELIASTSEWLKVDVAEISTTEGPGGQMLHYNRGMIKLQYSSTGALYAIGVFAGYLGKYSGTIGVGDRLASVLRYFPLWYDSGDELHYPTGESGVSGIAFLADTTSLEEDSDQVIHSIVVCNWDLIRA